MSTHVFDVYHGDKIGRLVALQVNQLNLSILENRENTIASYGMLLRARVVQCYN
jgi:hypothetical protein